MGADRGGGEPDYATSSAATRGSTVHGNPEPTV